MSKQSIQKTSQIIRDIALVIWRFAKSDEALVLIKLAATGAAFIQSVEEYRKLRRKIGFRK